MPKYNKKQIIRNRIIAIGALAGIILIIVVACVSCGGGGGKKYTESGPMPADGSTTILTPQSVYNYGAAVPQSASVGDDYFSTAVFIGESNIGGMRLYTTAVPSAAVYYSDSASVASGMGQSLSGETPLTITEIMAQKAYSDIYLQFGLNELGFNSKSAFYDYYATLLDEIIKAQPNARIYLLSVLPVSKEVDAAGVYTIAGVKQYNDYILQLAKEKKLFYVDIANPFTDSTGYLKDECSVNGLVIKTSCYTEWQSYIYTHTAPSYLK